MSILKIARMGHPVLRQVAAEVEDPTAAEIQTLIQDMRETMADADGVGLAAPQVHVSLRVMIFEAPASRRDESDESEDTIAQTVLINPEIEILGDETFTGWEGCLSVPGLTGSVTRFTHIRYRGVGLDGDPIEREARGFHARVFQHEFDHLDGILYPMRMTDMASLHFVTETRHMIEAADDGEDDGEDGGEDGGEEDEDTA